MCAHPRVAPRSTPVPTWPLPPLPRSDARRQPPDTAQISLAEVHAEENRKAFEAQTKMAEKILAKQEEQARKDEEREARRDQAEARGAKFAAEAPPGGRRRMRGA